MNNFDISSEIIEKIEKIIEYKFANKDLLKKSFTHTSIINKDNYEQLEFLGDSIISFITSKWLYENNPTLNPGQLTIKRAQIINNHVLSDAIRILEIDQYILVGKKVEINNKICSDVYEALTAAIFLDSGIDKSYNFFKKTILNNLDKFNKIIDYKGLLINYLNHNKCYDFTFKTDYHRNLEKYISYIYIQNKHLYGFGGNKKEAEMNVAEIAVKNINKKLF